MAIFNPEIPPPLDPRWVDNSIDTDTAWGQAITLFAGIVITFGCVVIAWIMVWSLSLVFGWP